MKKGKIGSWQQVLRFTSRHKTCVRPRFKDAKGHPRSSLPTGLSTAIVVRAYMLCVCAQRGSSSIATHASKFMSGHICGLFRFALRYARQ
eukprot:4513675-Amphidinium_carterae.1